MELKTKKGELFLIDDEDYDLIKHITWCKNIGYVRGYCKIDKKLIYLHRVIMGVSKDKTKMIDHKNDSGGPHPIINRPVFKARQHRFIIMNSE